MQQPFAVGAVVSEPEAAQQVPHKFVGRTRAGIPITRKEQDASVSDRVGCVWMIVLDFGKWVERRGVDRDDGDVGHRAFEADAREPGGDRGPSE